MNMLQPSSARSVSPHSAGHKGMRPPAALPLHEPGWQPSTRYADQPVSLGTRLFGIGGIVLVALIITVGALVTWTTYQAPQTRATLSVFDVAPPASPPEAPRATPPEPEQVQKEKTRPEPDLPRIEPPEIRLQSENPLLLSMARPTPDPGPPVEKTTAPESKPAPPAPQQIDAKPTWEGLVMGALNKVKRYPRLAMNRRQQGVPYIRFVMDREGNVLSSHLERSSGFPDLDREAVALPKRASPLPKPPQDKPGATLEIVLPVEFFIR